ncbi:MAG: hypothetical protein LUE23_08450 [Lachnospiraceae bacterium]|nr:hypothetical protein [Lachnospiraceae bacterium]
MNSFEGDLAVGEGLGVGVPRLGFDAVLQALVQEGRGGGEQDVEHGGSFL